MEKLKKLINDFVITNASVHNSQVIIVLLTKKDKGQPFYDDGAYSGEGQPRFSEMPIIILKTYRLPSNSLL